MSWPAIDVNEGEGKHEVGIHPSIYITARAETPASLTHNQSSMHNTNTHTHSMPVRYKGSLYSDEAWCLLEQQLGPGWWRYDDDDDDEYWRKHEEEMNERNAKEENDKLAKQERK